MTLDNNEFRGSALPCTLHASLDSVSLDCEVDGDVSGWPNGATHRTFVVEIDTGTDNEERILCSSLTSSGPAAVVISTRGYDGTTAHSHAPGAAFVHVMPAGFCDEVTLHVTDQTRDDHGQYLTVGRHNDPNLHQFGDGEALGIPGAPQPIGPSGAGAHAGVAGGPPHDDHVHVLGPGAIDNQNQFGAEVVPPAALQTGIPGANLAANSLTPGLLNIGMAGVAVGDSTASQAADATHILLPPDPTLFTFWRQGDKSRLYVTDGTHWRWLAGSPLKCALSYPVDGNNIANDFVAHDLMQFSGPASDPAGMASGGGLITIPAAVTGPPAYAYDGEWEFSGKILAGNAGSGAGATFQLWLVANGTNYLVWSGANAPGHSTLMPFSQRVTMPAAATAKLQLAHSAPSSLPVLAGSTFEARYRGAA